MDGTMRAIVLEDREKLVLRELPIPQIGPDDILFRVLYASICGTDLPSYRDLHYLQKMPVVLGHEFTGVVVETGSHIKDIPVGLRFMGTNFEWCGTCEACLRSDVTACPTVINRQLGAGRNGVFAEYAVLHKARLGLSVFPLPDCINDLEGTLCEPMGVGVTSVNGVLHPTDSDRIVVYGAGIIGQSYIQAIKAVCNCEVAAVDISDLRLDLARQSGADLVINPSKGITAYDYLTEHWGYGSFAYHPESCRASGNATIAIDCTSNMGCVSEATEIVGMNGRVCLAAGYGDEQVAKIRPMNLMLKGVQVFPGWGGNFQGSIDYIASGKYSVGHLITHIYPLEDLELAFHAALDPQRSCKVCIKVAKDEPDFPYNRQT